MTDNPTRDEIEARLAAVDARGQALAAQLTAKMDVAASELHGQIVALTARVEALSAQNRGTKSTIFVTGLLVVVVLIGALVYGSQLFGVGISANDVVEKAAERAAAAAVAAEPESMPSLSGLAPSGDVPLRRSRH